MQRRQWRECNASMPKHVLGAYVTHAYLLLASTRPSMLSPPMQSERSSHKGRERDAREERRKGGHHVPVLLRLRVIIGTRKRRDRGHVHWFRIHSRRNLLQLSADRQARLRRIKRGPQLQ